MKHPNYDRAFHETPDYIRSAIELGMRKGEKRRRARQKFMGALAVAATFAVILGAAALGASRLAAPKPDNCVASRPRSSATAEGTRGAAAPESTPAPTAFETPVPYIESTPALTQEPAAQTGGSATPLPAIPISDVSAEDAGDGVAVTPESTPESTPAPTAFATPEPSADPTLAPELPLVFLRVRADEGADPRFHLEDAACGEALPEELSLSTALWLGLTPCPDCVEGRGYRLLVFRAEGAGEVSVQDGLWYTENGVYLHVDSTCSNMANARKHGIAEAFVSGKRTCPVCMQGWVCALALEDPASESALIRALDAALTEYVPGEVSVGVGLATASEGLESVEMAAAETESEASEEVEMVVSAAEPDAVYFAEDGRNFHGAPDCPVLLAEEGGDLPAELDGRSGAIEGSPAEALRAGREPCPECLADWSVVRSVSGGVYFRPGDARFHRSDSCGGASFDAIVPLRAALERGMVPCELCLKERGALLVYRAESGRSECLDALWDTEDGLYFHACANCSGMRGARRELIFDALRGGKRPCPECLAAWEFVAVRDVRGMVGAMAECIASASGGAGEYQIAVSAAAGEEVEDVGEVSEDVMME